MEHRVTSVAVVCSDDGVGGLGGEATHVVVALGQPEVSLLPPHLAPAVLDDPVVLTALRAVADSEHSVIELGGGAAGLLVDAALLQLERLVASVHGNGDGSDLRHSHLEVLLAPLHVLE